VGIVLTLLPKAHAAITSTSSPSPAGVGLAWDVSLVLRPPLLHRGPAQLVVTEEEAGVGRRNSRFPLASGWIAGEKLDWG